MKCCLTLKTNMSETRQETVVETLQAYWSDRPHLRLGQIVSNAFRVHPSYKKNPEPEIQDIFYMSDKHFLEGLELLKENESKDQRSSEG